MDEIALWSFQSVQGPIDFIVESVFDAGETLIGSEAGVLFRLPQSMNFIPALFACIVAACVIWTPFMLVGWYYRSYFYSWLRCVGRCVRRPCRRTSKSTSISESKSSSQPTVQRSVRSKPWCNCCYKYVRVLIKQEGAEYVRQISIRSDWDYETFSQHIATKLNVPSIVRIVQENGVMIQDEEDVAQIVKDTRLLVTIGTAPATQSIHAHFHSSVPGQGKKKKKKKKNKQNKQD